MKHANTIFPESKPVGSLIKLNSTLKCYPETYLRTEHIGIQRTFGSNVKINRTTVVLWQPPLGHVMVLWQPPLGHVMVLLATALGTCDAALSYSTSAFSPCKFFKTSVRSPEDVHSWGAWAASPFVHPPSGSLFRLQLHGPKRERNTAFLSDVESEHIAVTPCKDPTTSEDACP